MDSASTIDLKKKLAGKSLMLSVPSYDHTVRSAFNFSAMNLGHLCQQYGVKFGLNNMSGPLVTRMRNYCASVYLSNPHDFNLWVDSDIEFNAMDVLRLMALDKEFIGGAYRKKTIDWEQVRSAIIKNPAINPSELEYMAGSYEVNLLPHDIPTDQNVRVTYSDLMEAQEIGAGFWLLQRSVYEKLIASGTVRAYRPAGPESRVGTKIYDFFRADIDPDSDHYLPEDFWFCRSWKKIGGQIWLAPWVKLNHWGTYRYRGDLLAFIRGGFSWQNRVIVEPARNESKG